MKSVQNYEIGNGILAIAERGGKEYEVYLQLPNTPDSQHAFLTDPDMTENRQDFLDEIVAKVEKEYNSITLAMITEFGHDDFTYDEVRVGRNNYYVFVNNADYEVHFRRESNYANYYNCPDLIENLSHYELDDDEIMSEIEGKAQEIIETLTNASTPNMGM